MDPDLAEYLQHVGIDTGATASIHACEICAASEFTSLVDEVKTDTDYYSRLPVVACSRCGFVMQNPRFNKEFYDAYYNHYYRLMLFGNKEPEKDFIADQVRRGTLLYNSLQPHLPERGRLLDVGCSAGGLMVPFVKHGWDAFGTDPDLGYVAYGCERLGLKIEAVAAEDMKLPSGHYDLIVITGSLEHVYDVNRVLEICRRASADAGLLLVEGRAFNYGVMNGYFSHNHRRYLTANSIQLLMLKHGWTPLWTTDKPICGPTRPGGVYALGKASMGLAPAALRRTIEDGLRDEAGRLKACVANMRGAAA